SAIVVYETYVGSLDDTEQAALWEDYKVVGRLFGLRRTQMPATLAELRAYGREMLGSDRIHVGDWARRRAREIVLEPPVPPLARPLVETVNFITIALLPKRIRTEYGFGPLPPAPVRRALVAAGGLYVRRGVMPVLPAQLRQVPAARRAA
ncbi:MAG: oxygenase MpaB family protein, partial [Solirubrobacteraceae bacterium]